MRTGRLRWLATALSIVVTASGCTAASPTTDPVAVVPRVTASVAATATPTPTASGTPLARGGPPSPSIASGGAYLAIGDSITFGIGVPRPRREGFVGQVARALATATPPIVETRVFAVPGETATGFLERRLDDVRRAIAELGPRVELVTIGLGANELLRTRRDPACDDRSSAACAAVVATAVDAATASLEAIVGDVASALAAAGSDARILLLAYYNPDTEAIATSSVAGSDGRVACDAGEAAPGLDDRIACVAAAHGAEVIDLHAAFLGREADLTRIGEGDVHPNAAGYAVIADAILDELAAD